MPSRIHYLTILICTCAVSIAQAQQFSGLSINNYSAVQQIPCNPAWVCRADGGTELHFFSASGLIGTNAYTLSKGWLTRTVTGAGGSTPVEDQDYVKDQLNGDKKYIWANADVLGPAISFRLRPNIFVGAYTRVRQVAGGGNLTKDALQFIGDRQHVALGIPAQVQKAGFTLHVFTETGVTYGAILKDDGYHRWRAGGTVKYLTGLAAGSVYADDIGIQLNDRDSAAQLNGTVSVKYSSGVRKLTGSDANNSISSWLNGGEKHSFGFDIGLQYEYHPDYNPNKETPYLFSIAASVTDVGGIWYRADTGSKTYSTKLNYVQILQSKPGSNGNTPGGNGGVAVSPDSVSKADSTFPFRVALPTAFRLNADLQLGDGFAFAADILLNLQSSKDGVYNPGYANTFCFTPRYETKHFMIGLPFCFVHHQQMTAGVVLRAGPVFIGSSSAISCAITNHVNALDGYMGVCMKFKHKGRTFY
jgi:hypothetical protein